MYVTSRQIEILSLGTIVLEVLRAIQVTKKNTFLTNVEKKVPRIVPQKVKNQIEKNVKLLAPILTLSFDGLTRVLNLLSTNG